MCLCDTLSTPLLKCDVLFECTNDIILIPVLFDKQPTKVSRSKCTAENACTNSICKRHIGIQTKKRSRMICILSMRS
jgi:hypothetical protein